MDVASTVLMIYAVTVFFATGYFGSKMVRRHRMSAGNLVLAFCIGTIWPVAAAFALADWICERY